jgi:hypothetical protein
MDTSTQHMEKEIQKILSAYRHIINTSYTVKEININGVHYKVTEGGLVKTNN